LKKDGWAKYFCPQRHTMAPKHSGSGSSCGERTEGASALDRCPASGQESMRCCKPRCKRLDAPVHAHYAGSDEAYGGQWRDQFVLEILSSGAGTALNINVKKCWPIAVRRSWAAHWAAMTSFIRSNTSIWPIAQ